GAAALLVPPLPDDPGRRVAADDPRPGRGRDGPRAGPDRRALGLPRGQRAALAAPLLRPPLGGRPRPRPRARPGRALRPPRRGPVAPLQAGDLRGRRGRGAAPVRAAARGAPPRGGPRHPPRRGGRLDLDEPAQAGQPGGRDAAGPPAGPAPPAPL